MYILDCTLRDGGYYTSWDFDPELVKNYLLAMSDLSIDYVELGFRSSKNKDFKMIKKFKISRNEKFYNNYSIKQFFLDIARHKSINFINFLNTIEQNFIIDPINDTTSNVLVIRMAYGREIDIVKKIKPNINIHALDFNKQFINWGKNNYKNILFELYDLNSKNVAFNFEKYDLYEKK